MNYAPLYDALRSYYNQNIYPFHTPGHKQGRGLQLPHPMTLDLTEVEGLDNLYAPTGPIAQAQKLAARLFGAEDTYFLVNGSTVGILTAIAATCGPEDTLLVARNSHRSVYSGMIMTGVKPKYIMPDVLTEYGLTGGISPKEVENKLAQYPEAKAVLLVSPTYEGFTSDLSTIAQMVHEQDKILIVDEAHGAHFKFHVDFPMTALQAGADIVIQSTHKTLPAFTQTAMLHVQGHRVSRDKIRERLSLFQSSSPSYLFMAGLDYCRYQLEKRGREDFNLFLESLYFFREKLASLQVLELVGKEVIGQGSIADVDLSKILLSTRYADTYGTEVERILRRSHQIQMELSGPRHLVGISTVSDETSGFKRLVDSLFTVDRLLKKKEFSTDILSKSLSIPKTRYTPREANFMEHSPCLMADSVGEAIGEFVIPYPPGIPLLVPGEVMTEELLKEIQDLLKGGVSLIGMGDTTGETIQRLEDRKRGAP
ncbi:MAG: aminotransferase class I/II-fold pyridoxal phosphate-dependent enzyme [Epulopiscium sp.]|nr:aminotransferase class I/II-fold pyridoxal phosphate-dependent enzyme [Candidatus Epulonipiscium sp.]